MVDEEDIAALNAALQPILERELANGNCIVETWRGWPSRESVGIALGKPFHFTKSPLPPAVVYRDVNDPHYWKSEYEHEPSRHLVVCRF